MRGTLVLREDDLVTAGVITEPLANVRDAVSRVAGFPRLRYMGSKYRLVPHLADAFAEAGGRTALDAFSGSGVVSYLLKTLGYQVTSNDFLAFPTAIARATVVNQSEQLTGDDIDLVCGPPADDRDFIQRTFQGLYFTEEDRAFLDSAWSHIDRMSGHKQAIAISALVLAAARKQPRGVFTFTNLRYDDGRRDLHISLREHFRERAAAYNQVVFDSGQPCIALSGDVFDLPAEGRQLLHQALPFPRRPVGVLARPADHGEHSYQEARQAVHPVLLQANRHRGAKTDTGAIQGLHHRLVLLFQCRPGRRHHRRAPARRKRRR
jgi:adenine-specific DNA-methyltransferase